VKHTPHACDDRQLQLLLSTDEQSDEFCAAAMHVEACPRCQLRLSDLAANASQWDEACRLLSEDPSDAALAAEQLSCEARAIWTEKLASQLLAPPSHPEMLGRIGRYEVERLIGSGGMGIVFKAFDSELHRPVAIKVLAPHLAGSGAARQRFAREARAAAAVVHEHVVAIHNVESDGAAPFLVMQFVAGESLQTRLDRQGPLDLSEILRIGRQTASGLAAAHAQGLVHRDIKPANILLEHGVERTLLTDFGLARAADDASLTHTGNFAGTPHYMSPEQACGDAIDPRSDLFSLGSVLYAMSTGRPPFRADTSMGILRRITDTRPRPICEVNPDVPVWLDALVTRLHAKLPADRIQTASEVVALFEQCLAHVRQPTDAPLPEILRPKQTRRFFTWPIVAGALLVLALTVMGIALWSLTNYLGEPDTFRGGPVYPAVNNSTQGDPPNDTDWDAAARQVESLDADSNTLATEVEQFWGGPTLAPLPSTVETMP
jgi:serine/threonine protein kinase